MENKVALSHKNVRHLERAQNYGDGRGSVLGLVPRYEPDGPGLYTDGGRVFVLQTGRGTPSNLLYKEYRVFNGGKAAVAWCWLPPSL
jgi:hypothetical protein